ncbi:MAG: 3-deoxy-manno-octulosonate cytidylyltransferase [Wenzhouxiangella sp.]|jgi:3-deoxy-manno-octulosonate cytidylyltransferase (CMP-KDO synthetase)|nr:3-deoxy-manno-octulosonate cytidylyltransferase [Wenzhouxiangella sp.]
MTEGFHVLIPARLASTRLPDKPLADLGGRSMVVRVLERALAAGAAGVHVATDSERVARCVRQAGGQVVMTRSDHVSGTDRLVEAVQQLGLPADQVVVNLQGDEPLMPVAAIRAVVELLETDLEARIATLWRPLQDEAQWRDPNVVKVVADGRGRALYFSRAPVPWPRSRAFRPGDACRHVGLYAYRVGALLAWPTLPSSPLEALESLEQLRALAAGWAIACAPSPEPVPSGIDTPEDLARIRAEFFNLERSP